MSMSRGNLNSLGGRSKNPIQLRGGSKGDHPFRGKETAQKRDACVTVTATKRSAKAMYNKLFSKILDSSIWLAPDPHRLVWITILAAMDEDGNIFFASVANLAARARVALSDATEAVKAFESPDVDSADPDNEGRRIERFPGGWHVLNAHKYRALVNKAIIREQTRERVAKHRAAKKKTEARRA